MRHSGVYAGLAAEPRRSAASAAEDEESTMNAPHNNIFDVQLAALELSAIAFTRSAQFWMHLGEAQAHMLGHHPDERRTHVEIAHGASFNDRYGKRLHDIDPEHDV
jgi:hypothetical protein